MADIAKLGLEVDSGQVTKATAALDKMAVSAERTEDAVSDLGQMTSRSGKQIVAANEASTRSMSATEQAYLRMQRQMREAERVERAMAHAMRASAIQRQMLIYQLNDVAVSLASGMNPMMVFMQQGSQLSQMQGGLAGAFKETARLGVTVAQRYWLIAAAAAAIGLAVNDMRGDIEKASGKAVTFGDVAWGAVEVIGDGIYSLLEPAIKAIAPWFDAAWDGIQTGAKAVANAVMRSALHTADHFSFAGTVIKETFSAAYDIVKNIWSKLPAVFGDIVYSAVNRVIDGTEAMINGISAKINTWIDGINSMLAGLGEWRPSWLGDIGRLNDKLDFGNVTNPHAGAAAKAGKEAAERWGEANDAIKAAFDEMLKSGKVIDSTDWWAAFKDQVAVKAVENMNQRLDEQADKGKKVKDAADKAVDAWKGLRKETTDWRREYEQAVKDAQEKMRDSTKAIEQTLGSTLSSLFSEPMKDADAFFEKLKDGFAQLGQQQIGSIFENFFAMRQASNDNSPAVDIEREVKRGSFQGTAMGMIEAFKAIGFGTKGAGMMATGIGAGLGGLGIGLSTGNPVMGGLGGAMGGLSAGFGIASAIGAVGMAIPVLGAIVGARGGKFGYFMTKMEQAA